MAASNGDQQKARSLTSSEIYVNDLAEIQTYLERLQQVMSECEDGTEHTNEFVLQQYATDDYLTVLRIKQRQLADIMAYATKTTQDHSTSQLMTQMVDVVEPLCNDLIQTLSKLRAEEVKTKPESAGVSDEAAVDLHLARNEEIVAPMKLVNLGSHPVGLSTVPDLDVDDYDEDVVQDDAGDALVSAAAEAGHISAAHDDTSAGNVSAVASLVLPDQAQQQQREHRTEYEEFASFEMISHSSTSKETSAQPEIGSLYLI